MIFDSVFNAFRGGHLFPDFQWHHAQGRQGAVFHIGKEYLADEIGILQINQIPKQELSVGNVGYIITGIKNSKEVKVGDTLTLVDNPCKNAIRGLKM